MDLTKVVDRPWTEKSCKVASQGVPTGQIVASLQNGHDLNKVAAAFEIATGVSVHPTSISRHLRGLCGCR